MPDETARLRRWRAVTVATLFTGYAGYYVCRSVLPVASTGMMNDPGSGISGTFRADPAVLSNRNG